MIPLQLECKK